MVYQVSCGLLKTLYGICIYILGRITRNLGLVVIFIGDVLFVFGTILGIFYMILFLALEAPIEKKQCILIYFH